MLARVLLEREHGVANEHPLLCQPGSYLWVATKTTEYLTEQANRVAVCNMC